MTQEGYAIRRFYDLVLVRSQTPIFGLSWLVMHPITPASPLYGQTPERLAVTEVELWVSLTSLDETVSQTIHSRYAYGVSELCCYHRFVDIFYQGAEGQWLSRFHETESLVAPPPSDPGEGIGVAD